METEICEYLEENYPAMIAKIAENQETIDNYNCFGFVASVFGWNETLTVEFEEETEAFLRQNTTEISEDEVASGDIVVYREKGELSHIGIVVSARRETYIAKMGDFELCFDDMKCGAYDYGACPSNYYRVNNN